MVLKNIRQAQSQKHKNIYSNKIIQNIEGINLIP